MSNRRFCCAAVALLLCNAAWAQGPAATPGKGSISGTVLDSRTGRPIIGATIAVNGQSTDKTVADADGKFLIPLTPGSYTIRLSAPQYASLDLTGITVQSGQNAEASGVLSSIATIATSVDVVEKIGAMESTAEAMLTERRYSALVSDNISRSELAAGVSSDAAGALEKVTGVSVVGEGFVYVRGLGERYSSTQLNGAFVPTTEPEKRVVPLDLFPSGLIENIRILKTYSPDLPAEFSGGLVDMKTVEFPAQKVFKLSVKSGFNTMTSLNPFLTYPGGNDFWGFGNASRGLPSLIPADARVIQGRYSADQLQAFGRSFSNNWQPSTVTARPGLDWSAVAGGTFGRIGVIGAVSFSNKPQLQSELLRYIRQGAGAPLIFTEYPDYKEYSESARLGAVFNVAVKLTQNHKLVFHNTFTHDADKSVREFAGYDGGVGSDLKGERLRFVERSLFSTGVEGSHAAPRWRNSLFHWQMTYSRSTRDEPDLREVIRNLLPNGSYIYSASGSSGIRFFSGLADRIYEPQFDYSIPFVKGPVAGLFKVGGRVTVRNRDFQARRFVYTPILRSTLDLFLPSNQLFAASNIRPDGFQLIEFTRATDSYNADMNIFAGYAMVDLSFGAKWRVAGGIRVEDSDQRVVTYDNRIPNATPVLAGLQNRDPAPAVNVIYAATSRQNLRGSYSRTVSRPDFRELSPFDFNNVVGGFVTSGNPELKRATINNYDVRWEWFTGGNQLLAASFFAKTFDKPIEQTILPSNDLRQTFVNAKSARNVGLELEIRRSLKMISPKLREVGVSSNFTFVDSNVQINPADATIVTSQSRPLLGQSRYLANAIVEWNRPRWGSDARFYVNYVSRRITDVGTFRVPDLYQEGNVFLDFAYQYSFGGKERERWGIKFEAENLLDNNYRWTQEPFVQRQYQLGRTFQVGLSYTVF